uniref:RNA helicase n=1 Tax=Parascaris univalens TaxID=6257 RepID=A0A915AK36_PARUN
MSSISLPKGTKNAIEGTVIIEESSLNSYDAKEGTSNALVMSATRKKRIVRKEKGQGGDAKKIQAKKRRLEAIEAKVSKSKMKKLAKILERKQKKESREALFESLQQYQLPIDSMKNLISTSQMQNKEKKVKHEKAAIFPEKLDSLSGGDFVLPTIHNRLPQQEDYYETDSESDESVLNMEKEEPTTSTPVISIDEEEGYSTGDGGMSTMNGVADIKLEEPQSLPRENGSAAEQKSTSKESSKAAQKYMQRMRKDAEAGLERKHVMVARSEEVESQRAKLPIYCEEQAIVEAISENTCVIVCGETGSGKTTQLPQFLYEAGYASGGQMIGITEPRRVAAISMASRVAYEMNLHDIVSYQIRYEGNRSSETRILFMTDGVLMKELQKDIMLSAYSVIIIDEAHERSMYSDVLIGLLSRIAPLRARTVTPLKLIIMSATLRLADFTQKLLFPTTAPCVLKVESRQYPVTVHFERRTPDDYLRAALRKVCRIHETLPPGTVLVFLSGRLEVETLLKWLIIRYPLKRKGNNKDVMRSYQRGSSRNRRKRTKSIEVKLENYEVEVEEERNADLDEMGIADNVDDDILEEIGDTPLGAPPADVPPLFCLPLYSLLSSDKQKRVFEPVPDGCRLCVIATNVAETSLTIPGVRYVVDSGREKRRVHDPVTGVSQFIVHWISQASADQRAGRAGRVQAGHVYRLYSSAVFADLEKFSTPEILNKPVDQLVLHMKSMNIVKVANFPFPTRPDGDALEEAEKRLIRLGALEVGIKNKLKEARISALGKTLSMFPLAPKFAKMLVMANQSGLLPYACTLVAVLSVREPLIPIYSLRGETNEETQAKMLAALKQRRAWCVQGQARRFGDLAVLLNAVLASLAEKGSEEVCTRYGVRHKALSEVSKLRLQLINLINSLCQLKQTIAIDPSLPPPSETQIRMLRQIVIASLSENIARRVESSTTNEETPKGAYECQKLKDHVFIDASSVLYKDEPDWILFQEIVQVSGKKCMQNVMTVESDWLSRLAAAYCEFSPIKNAEPRYDRTNDAVVLAHRCTFGDKNWSLGEVDRPMACNLNVYRQFGRFFLDGSVCPQLADYASKLLVPPTAMIKSWAKLQRRTEKLLNALVEYEVSIFPVKSFFLQFI